MSSYYFTVRSVTYAQRGEQALTRRGYRCTIQRTPRWMEEQGCGYCLQVWGSPGEVRAILQDAGVPIRKIYTHTQDGTWETL